MKIDLPQVKAATVTDRPLIGQTLAPAMSFEACLDTAQGRREQQSRRAFEFLELGVFGSDRDNAIAAADIEAEPAAPGEVTENPQALGGEVSRVGPRRSPEPPPLDLSPPKGHRKALAGTPSSPVAATPGLAPQLQAEAYGGVGLSILPGMPAARALRSSPAIDSSGAIPLAGRIQTASAAQRATAPPEPAPDQVGAARPRPVRTTDQQGAVRVTVQQTERGLVVQAFVNGGVTDETVARLRQRARDLALEHGQTLADLTINGTRIVAAPSRRTL